ncbi:hypothetical protein VE01_05428 [Pseudogymnoascus verrucosus]|uniref:Uncharacterized protein n=1 Tax=Pseudogymnoascus verrucosus TaxID=342668 RepID=A0A1B8GM59_9PEZI|nr:uncharacterized protein VE01_05428 [Pseudogymnoascus verrucosus]OBT96878.2 hypothetical protein VE01_05428 [Pseudogymnoascus verrucosus]
MSQPTNTKLMDTSPGGESFNQYDEATVFTSPNTEQKPNFGDDAIPPRGPALSAQQKTARERKDHRDQNRRYEEAISEHGFGGTTMGTTHTTTSTRPRRGSVDDNGESGVNITATREEQQQQRRHSSYETSPEVEEKEVRDRKRQGYGEGSGVGG